jgi:hypothetical protein
MRVTAPPTYPPTIPGNSTIAKRFFRKFQEFPPASENPLKTGFPLIFAAKFVPNSGIAGVLERRLRTTFSAPLPLHRDDLIPDLASRNVGNLLCSSF